MVNQAGRSRGCSTCRRRRVKCDENRPVCGQCRRGGFQCSGPREMAFIEAKIQTSKNLRVREDALVKCTVRKQIPDALTIPHAPSLEDMKYNILICYSRMHLSHGSPIDIVLQEVQLDDYSLDGTVEPGHQVLHQLARGFAAIVYGTKHSQSLVAREGYILYGRALKRLNQNLSDPLCYQKDDILLSVAILALLESFVPTGPGNFVNHIIGLQRLLQLRGPGAYGSNSLAHLDKNVQYMLLFASFRARKGSILADPEWKAFLKAHGSTAEVGEQQLREILADCTVLAARCKESGFKLNAAATDSRFELENIKLDAWNILSSLDVWRDRWKSFTKYSYCSTPLTSVNSKANLSKLPDMWPFSVPALEFESVPAAMLLMLYNMTCIHVLQILASGPEFGYASSATQSSTKSKTHRNVEALTYHLDENISAQREAAFEICRCIPYCLRDRATARTASVAAIRWAVAIAWKTLGGNESGEGRWITDLLNLLTKGDTQKALQFVDLDWL